MEMNLFQKTEIVIENIILQEANLSEVAWVVANTLGLEKKKVAVIDAGETHVALDILQHSADPKKFMGKKNEILNGLKEIKGVEVSEKTQILSQGILGTIGLDESASREVLLNSEKMFSEISRRVKKRGIVFSTGFEVNQGMIEDTNSPLIKKKLEENGFKVSLGGTIEDDEQLIAGSLRRALNEGHGLIITTGGTGAEKKDQTIEGLKRIDPEAATPPILTFKKGEGRHHKSSVCIGVGFSEYAIIIALPGPNDEVRMCLEKLPVFLAKERLDKHELAENLAKIIREKFRNQHPQGTH